MIIVTGTKRSGTSMWMQLLKAAGFPVIGDEFSRNWEETIREANPGGFWESKLRNGIYYATNPDPKTGAYLFPSETRRHCVKVFIPGLIKTDVAFIGRVIATMRPWRQYVRSLDRLYAMEREAQLARDPSKSDLPPPTFLPPVVEWWIENFSLVSDIVTRRHAFCMVAYDSVLGDREKTLRRVFDWLGDGDVESAITRVEPELRTQQESTDDSVVDQESGLDPEVIEVFDDLYSVVRDARPLEQAFVDRLNATNERLQSRIDQAMRETAAAQAKRKQAIKERKRAEAGGSKEVSDPKPSPNTGVRSKG